jgi:hypothetical protein
VIKHYRDQQLEQHKTALGATAVDLLPWFRANRPELEKQTGLSGPTVAAVPAMVQEFEDDPMLIADLGAMNRWPGRSSVNLDDYLVFWHQSCHELNAPGKLPLLVRRLLGL